MENTLFDLNENDDFRSQSRQQINPQILCILTNIIGLFLVLQNSEDTLSMITIAQMLIGFLLIFTSCLSIESKSLSYLTEYLLISKKVRLRKDLYANPGYISFLISDVFSKLVALAFLVSFVLQGSQELSVKIFIVLMVIIGLIENFFG